MERTVEDTSGQFAAIRPMATAVDAYFNSAYPRGSATGELWPGRGLSTALTTGVHVRLGRFSMAAAPVLAYHTNGAFPHPVTTTEDRSEHAYPWYPNIDWPVRHGTEAFWRVGPGQSFARVDFPWLSFGVSTENLWWGPGMRNAIILGNNAPGFPHAFLGSGDGWHTVIGSIHGEIIWGRLSESDYFDDDEANDHRLFTGVNLIYEPRGLDGFSVGAARTFQQAYGPGEAEWRDFFPFLESPLKRDLSTPDNPRGTTSSDQIAGIHGRYAPPGSGFEAWIEWVRNDHSGNMQDFWAEPEHSHAYTFGFQQVIGGAERWYRVRGEVSSLSTYRPVARPFPNWYSHGTALQGHTHEGQLLGAAIGPGSVAQFLGGDVFTRRGRHGVFIEHVRYDEFTYYRRVRPFGRAPDSEWSAGSEHYLRLGAVDVRIGMTVSTRTNRLYTSCSHAQPESCESEPDRELNWHIPLGIVWRPR